MPGRRSPSCASGRRALQGIEDVAAATARRPGGRRSRRRRLPDLASGDGGERSLCRRQRLAAPSLLNIGRTPGVAARDLNGDDLPISSPTAQQRVAVSLLGGGRFAGSPGFRPRRVRARSRWATSTVTAVRQRPRQSAINAPPGRGRNRHRLPDDHDDCAPVVSVPGGKDRSSYNKPPGLRHGAQHRRRRDADRDRTIDANCDGKDDHWWRTGVEHRVELRNPPATDVPHRETCSPSVGSTIQLPGGG